MNVEEIVSKLEELSGLKVKVSRLIKDLLGPYLFTRYCDLYTSTGVLMLTIRTNSHDNYQWFICPMYKTYYKGTPFGDIVNMLDSLDVSRPKI